MKPEDFLKPLIYSRVLQLFYHYCHHLTYGIPFVGDHSLFSEFYDELSSNYDKLAEYMIGTYGSASFSTKTINSLVCEKLNECEIESMSPDKMFEMALNHEKKFVEYLAQLDLVATLGIKNMVGDIYESSDVRVYKIKQRVK